MEVNGTVECSLAACLDDAFQVSLQLACCVLLAGVTACLDLYHVTFAYFLLPHKLPASLHS